MIHYYRNDSQKKNKKIMALFTHPHAVLETVFFFCLKQNDNF